MTHAYIITPVRTEEARRLRSIYGDSVGRYADKHLRASTNEWSNTISTVTKDNLLLVCYE